MQIKGAHIQAGVSTASLGKFDQRLEGEKDGERSLVGKRRKFMAVRTSPRPCWDSWGYHESP